MALRHAYLVRHGKAQEREGWSRRDSLRPLEPAGERQAVGIARRLRARVLRVDSSPAVRCLDTVRPLAKAAGLRLRRARALGEGADPADALALMRRMRVGSAAFCTHGDVMLGVLEMLADSGVRLEGGLRLPKGSAWRIDLRPDGSVVRARYLKPSR